MTEVISFIDIGAIQSYRKAGGKPLALDMGMNAVAALAAVKRLSRL